MPPSEIVEEAYNLTSNDPSVVVQDGIDGVWSMIWKYPVPIGIAIILKPHHTFSCYLENRSQEVNDATCRIRIEVLDASEMDRRIIYGPALYLVSKEFQDRARMATLNLNTDMLVLERMFIAVCVDHIDQVIAGNSYFALAVTRMRQGLIEGGRWSSIWETTMAVPEGATAIASDGDIRASELLHGLMEQLGFEQVVIRGGFYWLLKSNQHSLVIRLDGSVYLNNSFRCLEVKDNLPFADLISAKVLALGTVNKKKISTLNKKDKEVLDELLPVERTSGLLKEYFERRDKGEGQNGNTNEDDPRGRHGEEGGSADARQRKGA